jgi:transketolase
MEILNQALQIPLDERSKYLRHLVLKGIEGGERGHIGPALSVLEIIDVLYTDVMKHDSANPEWKERDYFILSKGHACLALYAVLASLNYFDLDELKTFCKYDSRLGGHPEWHVLPGIEFSTGSLGHGLAVATGLALAAGLKKSKQRVFVVLGDGELGEGSIWESAAHASKHKLSNLCVIIDFNKMQAFGDIDSVLPLEPLKQKWESFGFDVKEINGHSRVEIRDAVSSNDIKKGSPQLVIAHTIKGKGLSIAENSPTWHHKAKISKEDVENLKAGLR